MGVLPWLLSLTFSTLTLASLGFVYVRRRREREDEVRLREAVEQNLHVPQSLHPVIDTDRCIGSLSCISACPEGDILGIVDGKAHLVRGANCIGHGKCALECPVGAIQLVFGTSERGVDLPEVDAAFESSRRGVHVVGELGGMGLIRRRPELRVRLHVRGFPSISAKGVGIGSIRIRFFSSRTVFLLGLLPLELLSVLMPE